MELQNFKGGIYMIKVSSEQFDQLKEKIRFVQLEFSNGFEGIKSDSKFFGTEIGNDVLVVQLWNNDFCTSSFIVPNSCIASCNGRYTLSMNGSHDFSIDAFQNAIPLPAQVVVEHQDDEASIDQRMAAIFASNTDRENKYAIEEDEPAVIEEPVNKPEPLPVQAQPITTKGRQKSEETRKDPEPKTVITRKEPVSQPHKPAPVVRKSEPKVVKEDPFAGW
jgi:hypothetical protein